MNACDFSNQQNVELLVDRWFDERLKKITQDQLTELFILTEKVKDELTTEKNSSIKKFEFLPNKDTDFSFFKDLQSLTTLRICRHSMAIFKFLKHCKSLKTLYVDGNYDRKNPEKIDFSELRDCELEILIARYCSIAGAVLKNLRFLRELYLDQSISVNDTDDLKESAVNIFCEESLPNQDWSDTMKQIGIIEGDEKWILA